MTAEGEAGAPAWAGTRAPALGAAAPLLAGLLVLAVLWLGPLVPLSRRAFSAHMMLHLGLVVVAAPLIALGLTRCRLCPGEFGRPLAVAAAAAAFETVVVWGWHLPALHEAAARETPMFIAQQASFLLAGTVLWLAAFSGRSRAARGIGAAAMFFGFMHMGMLGALLTLAPALLYAPDVCLGAFGLDPLDDQRLGGVLMAVGGGPPFLAGGLVLAARFIAD